MPRVAAGTRARLCLALLLLWAGLPTACGRGAAPAAPACDPRGDEAIVVTLAEADGAPAEDVQLRVRQGDGGWTALPGLLGGEVTIHGGPGTYEIEALKEAHAPAGATVAVPAAADGCHAATQRVTLALAPIPCLTAPEPLRLIVRAPQPPPALAVTAWLPETGRQALACAKPGPSPCQTYALPLAASGPYRLTVAGLPGPGAMEVVDGVVGYAHAPFVIALAHGAREEVVRGAGARQVELRLPVQRDEQGCPLVDFRKLEVVPAPDLTREAPYPPAAVRYDGSLTMTDVGAAGCQVEPALTTLPLSVDLPAGTHLDDVRVFVLAGPDVREATCGLRESVFRCEAAVPNPLIGVPFAVKAIVAGQEVVGMQLPFSGLCLIFER